MILEHFFADSEGFLLTQTGKSEGIKRPLGAFDDKSCHFDIELVNMDPDPALVCFFKDEVKALSNPID